MDIICKSRNEKNINTRLDIKINICKNKQVLSRTDGRCCNSQGCRRGKSGLQRAGCRITSGEGDFRDSATEINRMETCKGGKAV